MLEIEVCEIRGKCPVHKVGDRIVIDGPRIVLEETDAVCVHALSSLLHYVLALEEGTDPLNWVCPSRRIGSMRIFSAWIQESHTLMVAP